jgi:uncharacterized glyoxalase superfamily protein PhnB
MPWITPYLTVKDAGKSLEFYERAFGFAPKEALRDPKGQVTHGELSWKGGVVMLGPEGAFGNQAKAPATAGLTSPVTIYVYCDDVDAMFARATSAGAKVIMPPDNMFWGDRMCKIMDPDGHLWNFACNVADFDPAKMH